MGRQEFGWLGRFDHFEAHQMPPRAIVKKTIVKSKLQVAEEPDTESETGSDKSESNESVDGSDDDSGSEISQDDISTDGTEEGDDEFEQQSSSDEEIESDDDSDVSESGKKVEAAEMLLRQWEANGNERSSLIEQARNDGSLKVQQFMHTDDLSSDDEQENVNTIGRVPLHWYDAYEHMGYTIDGERFLKGSNGKDRIDRAIENSDDPAASRTVFDMYNNREVVLSDRDLEIIRRIRAGAFAHPEHNDTPDYVDYFSSQKEIMPLSSAPEPKRRFVPSKWELMRVTKIVKAMKEGRFVDKNKLRAEEKAKPPVYMIWEDQEDEVLAESKRYQFHLPAPKMPLPGHAESFNPPPEYILSKEEQLAMAEQDPHERQYNFIPKKHNNLRSVGGYADFIKERFERCLDLYLCPRKMKRRLNIDPETLVPRLPNPRELKPFPNSLCLQFLGHSGAVRSLAVSPDGQYLLSGSDDCTVRLWEADTGLCRRVWTLSAAVVMVAWNPNPEHHLAVAVSGSTVVFIATGTGDADGSDVTESLIGSLEAQVNSASDTAIEEEDDIDDEDEDADNSDDNDEADSETGDKPDTKMKKAKFRNVSTWHMHTSSASSAAELSRHGHVVGPRVVLQLKQDISSAAWHYKGDYLVTLAPSAGAQAVAIHQISKGKSQCPFRKSPGRVQAVCFHPSRPFIFIATQQHVKVFNLVEQKMVKKLLTGCKWLSSLDVHPSGDHLIVGSYDRRVVWFDLDLSSKPFKTLKFHEKAVRHLQYHKRYPLMASASDDGTVHVFHASVYSDMMRNAMIVPLKVLRGHGVVGGLGVLSLVFHPKQPWLFSSGSDGVINLFQDI